MHVTQNPAPPKNGVRLLILDDHALFCTGLEQLFRHTEGIQEVASATDLQAGVRLAGRLMPQVVLLRAQLNDNSPYEVARAIRVDSPHTKLVFLDDTVRETGVRAAMHVGASGYWTKHAEFGELASAVHTVASGGTSFCPAVKKRVGKTAAGLQYRSIPAGKTPNKLDKLSPRELEVLLLLGRGLTVKRCAQHMGLSSSTVDNHKSRLMQKLGMHKTVDLVVLAMREGLLD